MRKDFPFLFAAGPAACTRLVLIAQTDHTNPFTETWKLNIAKSKFTSGPAPQSTTVTMAPDGTFTMEGIDGGWKANEVVASLVGR